MFKPDANLSLRHRWHCTCSGVSNLLRKTSEKVRCIHIERTGDGADFENIEFAITPLNFAYVTLLLPNRMPEIGLVNTLFLPNSAKGADDTPIVFAVDRVGHAVALPAIFPYSRIDYFGSVHAA